MEQELGIDTSEIDHDTLLFSTGVIDSFSLVSLLTFVEVKYEFRIGPTDVNLANFDSLGRMLAYIEPRING
jgi:acyl carrier protein